MTRSDAGGMWEMKLKVRWRLGGAGVPRFFWNWPDSRFGSPGGHEVSVEATQACCEPSSPCADAQSRVLIKLRSPHQRAGRCGLQATAAQPWSRLGMLGREPRGLRQGAGRVVRVQDLGRLLEYVGLGSTGLREVD